MVDHILKCSLQADRHQQVYQKLEQWLHHFSVPLKLHHILVAQLKFSLGDELSPVHGSSSASPDLQKFLDEQGKIGWSKILCGLDSSFLVFYMDVHLPEQANCDVPEWVIRLPQS